MSIFGDLLGAATKAVGGILGNSGGSILDKAGDALGGLIGNVTGDKLGDKVGDALGDLIGSDKIGDKVGDLFGNAIGGEGKVTDLLAGKAAVIGDKLGDLFGSDKAGEAIGGVLGSLSDENPEATAQAETAETPRPEVTMPPEALEPTAEDAEAEMPETLDLSNLQKPGVEDGEMTIMPVRDEFGGIAGAEENFDIAAVQMPTMVSETPIAMQEMMG